MVEEVGVIRPPPYILEVTEDQVVVEVEVVQVPHQHLVEVVIHLWLVPFKVMTEEQVVVLLIFMVLAAAALVLLEELECLLEELVVLGLMEYKQVLQFVREHQDLFLEQDIFLVVAVEVVHLQDQLLVVVQAEMVVVVVAELVIQPEVVILVVPEEEETIVQVEMVDQAL